jgi:hypothetical protein
VRNFPVQGNAASITRRAVVIATEQGYKVMCSLHDALYVISDNPKFDEDMIVSIMLEATASVLKQTEEECTMRVDTKIISHEDLWVEEKAEKDIEKLAPYLGLVTKLKKAA